MKVVLIEPSHIATDMAMVQVDALPRNLLGWGGRAHESGGREMVQVHLD